MKQEMSNEIRNQIQNTSSMFIMKNVSLLNGAGLVRYVMNIFNILLNIQISVFLNVINSHLSKIIKSKMHILHWCGFREKNSKNVTNLLKTMLIIIFYKSVFKAMTGIFDTLFISKREYIFKESVILM